MQDLELANSIERIELKGIAGDPPEHYLIRASGSVLQEGYTNPLLVIHSTTPDVNGVLTYYFTVEPPAGGTPSRRVPISAERYLFDLQKVKRIRVVAATNVMEQDL